MLKQTMIALTSAAAIGVGFAGSAEAGSLGISSYDSGWYSQTGTHNPTNWSTFTGTSSNFEYRSFGVFDLSTVTENIVGAELKVTTGSLRSNVGETAFSELFTVWDVTTDVSELLAGGFGKTDTFNDLGSGAMYGSKLVNGNSGDSTDFTVDLSGALDGLNAARGSTFATGQTCSTCSGIESFTLGVFSPDPVFELILHFEKASTESVPEPASLLGLAAIGAAAAGGILKKKATV